MAKLCQRPGCRFQRRRTSTSRTGIVRTRAHCSPECFVWLSRARRAAAAHGPEAEAEARQLLFLSVKLDARSVPTVRVPDVFAARERRPMAR